MIPQRSLSLLSNRLARAGGRRIPEAVLERDYCLAWFLVGLSRAPLRDLLAFKGGTALKRCYFGEYRFSEDLDFTLTADAPFEKIRSELDPVFEEVRRTSGIAFRFERQDRDSHANSHTFYLGYEGPLPARAAAQVKVDVTIKERVVRPLAEPPVVRGYDEYEDLPDGATVRAYSLEEIAAEKIVALGDRARNEPRDLYDIWYLTTEGHVDLAHLHADVEAKLEFRGKELSELAGEFKKKEARLKALWTKRLAAQMADLPEFEGVFRGVQRALRQADLVE
jgi:predicted nucleotidyltransferase component of viral defense system